MEEVRRNRPSGLALFSFSVRGAFLNLRVLANFVPGGGVGFFNFW